MTENEAISAVNTDADAAQALASAVAGDFTAFDNAVAELDAMVLTVGARLATLESNVRYAMENYL